MDGWILGGLVAVVLMSTGRYEPVQRWSRANAGKLFLGIWLMVALAVLVSSAGPGRPLLEVILVAAGGGLFSAFGVWLFLVGFDYAVNRPDGDPPQDTSSSPYGK